MSKQYKVPANSPFYETNRPTLESFATIWATAMSNPYFRIKQSIKSEGIENELFKLEDEIVKFNAFYNTETSNIINGKLDSNLVIGESNEVGIFYKKSDTELNKPDRYLVEVIGGSLKYFNGQYEKIQNITIKSANLIRTYDANKLSFSIEFKYNFDIQLYVSRLVVNTSSGNVYFSYDWYNDYVLKNKDTELTKTDIDIMVENYDSKVHEFLPIVVYSWFNDYTKLGRPNHLWSELALAEELNSRRLHNANIINNMIGNEAASSKTYGNNKIANQDYRSFKLNQDPTEIALTKNVLLDADGKVVEAIEINYDNLQTLINLPERVKQKLVDMLHIPDTNTGRRSSVNKVSSQSTMDNLNRFGVLNSARQHKTTFLFKELLIYLKLIYTNKLNIDNLDYVDLMQYFDVTYENLISSEQTNPQLIANIKQLVGAKIVSEYEQKQTNQQIFNSETAGVISALDEAQRGT